MFVILRDVLTAGQNNKRDIRIYVRNKFSKTDLHKSEEHRKTYEHVSHSLVASAVPVLTIHTMFLLHKHIKYVHLKINKEISFFFTLRGGGFRPKHGLRCGRTIFTNIIIEQLYSTPSSVGSLKTELLSIFV